MKENLIIWTQTIVMTLGVAVVAVAIFAGIMKYGEIVQAQSIEINNRR